MKLGLDAKAYVLTTGARASWGTLDTATGVTTGTAPTSLTEFTDTNNVSITLGRNTAEVKPRGKEWVGVLLAQKTASIDLELIWDPDDTTHAQLLTAFLLGTDLGVAILGSDKADAAGVQGFWADFKVTNLALPQPTDDVQAATATLVPSAESAVPPEWVKIAASGT